jgi:hypothetical protein
LAGFSQLPELLGGDRAFFFTASGVVPCACHQRNTSSLKVSIRPDNLRADLGSEPVMPVRRARPLGPAACKPSCG